jgi:hypothetical protein
MDAKVGDHIVIESERVGQPGREGVVLEVLSPETSIHYRVRWADGHESIFYPGPAGVNIPPGGKAAEPPRTARK